MKHSTSPLHPSRSRFCRPLAWALFVCTLALSACGRDTPPAASDPTHGSTEPEIELDVPFVPTPHEIVSRMLEIAEVGAEDYLIDLGSGDGRIVISAVRDRGARAALGVEIDPERIAEANAAARAAGVEDRVTFEMGDLFEKDFSEATVLTMYLLEWINLALRPTILETLAPGSRVVSHVFDMGDWTPDHRERIGSVDVYFWIVPARVGGTWSLVREGASPMIIEFEQQYQRIAGHARIDGRHVALVEPTLRGDEIRFRIGDTAFAGRVQGDRIETIDPAGPSGPWHARRE